MKKESIVLSGGGILPPKYLILALRLALGWLFIQSAYTKLTAAAGWTASGYLSQSVGPLSGWFHSMSGNGTVDGMVMFGELLIGVALVLGTATRFTALAGSAMLLLFYLAKLPPAGTWVNQQLIYLVALNVLAAARAGTFFGLDGLLAGVERRVPALRYVLG